jgi:hypothetical protein
LTLSIRARDARRAWGGNSAEAVVVACSAASALGEFDRLLQLASSTEGEATRTEASEPSVRQFLAFSRLGTDQVDPETPFEEAMFRGLQFAEQKSNRNLAIEAFGEAVLLAEDEQQLRLCLFQLASLGVKTLPRIEEVSDEVFAVILAALGEHNSDNSLKAITILRPMVGASSAAVWNLSQILETTGDPLGAAATLAAGGEQFGEDGMWLQAAQICFQENSYELAENHLAKAISRSPSESRVRRQALRLSIHLAIASGDPLRVEAAARSAIVGGDQTATTRWILCQSLHANFQLEECWRELRAAPVLVPETEEQGIFLLKLLARCDPARAGLFLEVLDAFPDSHEVQGIGCLLFISMEGTESWPEGAIASMQARMGAFSERYPNSNLLYQTELDSDDPQLLLQQLGGILESQRTNHPEFRKLERLADAGLVSVALLANLARRGCAETLISADQIVTTCIRPSEIHQEIQIALRTMDCPVVVDLSSIVVMSFLPEFWNRVVGSFSSVSIAREIQVDVENGISLPGSAGNLSLDHQGLLVTRAFSAEEQANRRFRFSQVRDWCQSLPKVRCPDLTHDPDYSRLLIEGEVSWLTSVATAKEAGVALLCDDTMTAEYARLLSVPVFSSFSLLCALARLDRVSEHEMTQVIETLHRAQANDLGILEQRARSY